MIHTQPDPSPVVSIIEYALGQAGKSTSSLQPWTKETIKATLQGFYTASGLVVVLLHVLNGLTTIPVLWYCLVSMPALILGTCLGSFFYGRIGDRTYKKIMLVCQSALIPFP